ncbi:hypothetical protein KY359_00240 [Candidatus Woesearchaeota archaeon]|nr:hypothetical protein [Candidatus Woesearchaeota archaeon]
MAAKPKKGKTVDKWRKKRYFSVLAPKVFQERELGHSMAYEPSELKGRTIAYNLMMITGNVKKQDINVSFKVTEVKGDTAFTMVDKYEVSAAAIKRKVRRQRDRLDESFQCVTRDNKILRLKPLAITAIKTSRSVQSALRKDMMLFITNYVRKTDYDTLVLDVINEKLQRETAFRLKKITPIRFVDIRVMKYVGEQKSAGPVEETPAPAVEETPKPEKEETPAEPKPKKRAPKKKAEEQEEAAAEEPAAEE